MGKRISADVSSSASAGQIARHDGPWVPLGVHAYGIDILLALLLSLGAMALTIAQFARLDFAVVSREYDLVFGADVPRLIETSLDRTSDGQQRSNVHPLWGVLVSAPLLVLREVGLDAQALATVLVAAGSFVLVAVMYLAVRLSGIDRTISVTAVLLFLSTAAVSTWLMVPETYALGAATLLVPYIWLCLPRGRHDSWSGPLQSALSLSITVTNWFAGILAAVLAVGWRRAARFTVYAFAAVAALSVVQSWVFPEAGKFLGIGGEGQFLGDGVLRDPIGRLAALAVHPLVMPAPTLLRADGKAYIFFEDALPPLDVWTIVAAIGWIALLVTGVVVRWRGARRLQIFLLIALGAQYALHLVYGDEVFLYALHFAPFLVLLAVGAARDRLRWPMLAVILVTAAATAMANTREVALLIDLTWAS